MPTASVTRGRFQPACRFGAGYQIRVTANDGAQPSGVSTQSFLITNNSHNYYINDASTTGDVFTTAPGNDSNSGTDPAHPMATLAALVQAYLLGPGDTVHVDTGNYSVLHNIVLDAAHSGVTIVGAGPGTVLNRGDLNPGSYVFQMQGAANVTIEDFTLTGALDGVFADTGANSTGLTVADCTIFGNANDGILLNSSNDNATLTGNTVYGDQGSSGAKQANGFELYVSHTAISNNIVYDHSGYRHQPSVSGLCGDG